MRLALLLLALVWGGPLHAQEAIPLGDGRVLTALGTGVEEGANGLRTLVLETRAEFDPEPYGPVPSSAFGRIHQAICENVVRGNPGAVAAMDVQRFRLIQTFRPEEGAPVVHRSLFDLDGGDCLHVPALGPGVPAVVTLPGGRVVALRHLEAGDTPDELEMTLETATEGDARFSLSNQNIAFEACAVLAPRVLARRAEGGAPPPRAIRVSIENRRPGPPDARAIESYRFAVVDGACVTGLGPAIEAELREAFAP
ncbi:hypothetical protein BCF33_0165 [Hasllibacter halocynthiae]|uniref:Uncharacterized protein n=1 Tax=Hasllibacter halocynthiae TaxID=595589 RepID=A0A2T0X6M3_9RHOB|nr:hypothetical protein [Hasllibacter halocynthiae]PRY94573.1 hypothetical protein BCF33_0165 [Hasllibacter halocynthiae]